MNALPSRFLEWLFRALLRLHPRSFRERWERELEQYLRESWGEEAAGRGIVAAAVFWKKAYVGVVATAVRQRLGLARNVAQRPENESNRERKLILGEAAIVFGGVEQYKEAGREIRGLTWMNGLSLDLKLAWRMLRKSPGLTVIGMLGIALGTSVGIVFFVLLSTHFFPRLPLNESDRLVALENWDVEAGSPDLRSLHDFITWREQMRSVAPIAAAALDEPTVVTGDAVPQRYLGRKCPPRASRSPASHHSSVAT
jgi:hypothetical protein